VLIECVVNVSEGRDQVVLGELASCAGSVLLDLHCDPDHHRSVFTLAGSATEVTEGAQALARACVSRLDLRTHVGAHPRRGVLDVVPFIPYDPARAAAHHDLSAVVPLRDAFARWLGTELGVPAFLYGPLPGGEFRTLPQVRAHLFEEIAPDFGPPQPHRSAGATAVGARPVLVAYNVWVSSKDVARQVAPLVRSPAVRALGLAVGDRAQVSCNLTDPGSYGPAALFDAVADRVRAAGGAVRGAELVGLLPDSVLRVIPRRRWATLGLAEEKTVESRLAGRA
jgi:glutamate formiminotransferase / 5-formyltetrahydrofolate cyclo-ligase